MPETRSFTENRNNSSKVCSVFEVQYRGTSRFGIWSVSNLSVFRMAPWCGILWRRTWCVLTWQKGWTDTTAFWILFYKSTTPVHGRRAHSLISFLKTPPSNTITSVSRFQHMLFGEMCIKTISIFTQMELLSKSEAIVICDFYTFYSVIEIAAIPLMSLCKLSLHLCFQVSPSRLLL